MEFRQTNRLWPVSGVPSPVRDFFLCDAARVSHALRWLSVSVRYCLEMKEKLALRNDCPGVLTCGCCALPLRTVGPAPGGPSPPRPCPGIR